MEREKKESSSKRKDKIWKIVFQLQNSFSKEKNKIPLSCDMKQNQLEKNSRIFFFSFVNPILLCALHKNNYINHT